MEKRKVIRYKNYHGKGEVQKLEDDLSEMIFDKCPVFGERPLMSKVDGIWVQDGSSRLMKRLGILDY